MVDMPTPESGTSSLETGAVGTSGQAGEGEEIARLRADNTRLRQQVAETEKLSARAVPLVRIAQALVNAPGGKEIVEKLQKGEPLTASEEKKVEAVRQQAGVPPGVPAEKPLTAKEARELFQSMLGEAVGQMGQTVAAERKAEESLRELDARGEKELEGYKHLKRDPQFQRQVNDILEQIKDGTIEVPEKEDDVWWFALRTAHKVIHALRGQPARAKKTETERVAEALAASGGRSTSATATGTDNVPEELRETIEKIRGYGTRTIAGKSFSRR